MQRVDRGDLHGFHRARLDASHDDAMPHAIGGELGAGLLDNFSTMGEKQRGFVALDAVLDDGGGNLGLAGASRSNKQRLVTLRERSLMRSTASV
jgi:hypothetical protein